MRPVSVFAKGPGSEIEQLRADLRGRWRQAARVMMVLLSLHGSPPAQIAEPLECHPATRAPLDQPVQRRGAGRADGPAPARAPPGWAAVGWPAGSPRFSSGRAPWTLPRIRRYLGWPQVSPRTLYRRVRLVAIWRRPELTPAVTRTMTPWWPGSWPGWPGCPAGRRCWPGTRGT
jgi:hypothetical protein